MSAINSVWWDKSTTKNNEMSRSRNGGNYFFNWKQMRAMRENEKREVVMVTNYVQRSRIILRERDKPRYI